MVVVFGKTTTLQGVACGVLRLSFFSKLCGTKFKRKEQRIPPSPSVCIEKDVSGSLTRVGFFVIVVVHCCSLSLNLSSYFSECGCFGQCEEE